MKEYYSTPFDETDMPQIQRVEYNGYKWGEVIDEHAARTFNIAKAKHRKNLKRMIELCEAEIGKIDEMTPETIEQTKIW